MVTGIKAVAMKMKSETDTIVSIQRLEDKKLRGSVGDALRFSLRYAAASEVGIIERASGVKSINLKKEIL